MLLILESGCEQWRSRRKTQARGGPECSEGGGRTDPKEICWVLAVPLGAGEPLEPGLQELSNSQILQELSNSQIIPPPITTLLCALFPQC